MKIGDVVQLKSGGPLMTVTEIHQPRKKWLMEPGHDGMASVEWFDAENEIQRSMFQWTSLAVVEVRE